MYPEQIHIADTLRVLNVNPSRIDSAWYISVASLIIAFFALLAPTIRDYLKERKRLKILKKYIFFILESLLKPLESKKSSLIEFSDNIKNIDNKIPRFAVVSTLLVDSFNKISHQDLHTIFILKDRHPLTEKHKHFKSITDAVDFFSKQGSIDQQNYFQFVNDLRRHEGKLYDNINSILRLFDSYVSSNKRNEIPPSKDPFLNSFDKIIHHWRSNKDFNSIEKTKKLMVDKLKKLCVEQSADERSIQILPLIIQIEHAYDDLVSLGEKYHSTFHDVAVEFSSSIDKLEKAIEFYKLSKKGPNKGIQVTAV